MFLIYRTFSTVSIYFFTILHWYFSGYYCPVGTIYQQPNATYCPVGHYCPNGSSQALPCANYTEVCCNNFIFFIGKLRGYSEEVVCNITELKITRKS